MESAPGPRPSLSVTLLFGLAMLCLGGIIGYFGRPLVTGERLPPVQAVQTVAPASQNVAQVSTAAAPTAPEAAAGTVAPTPTVDVAARATRAALMMSYVISTTRHFTGAANAPVTIVEYGDFQ